MAKSNQSIWFSKLNTELYHSPQTKRQAMKHRFKKVDPTWSNSNLSYPIRSESKTQLTSNTLEKDNENEELGKNHLEAINGEKAAKDAFLETRTQHYHVILFIHGDWFTFGFTNRSTETNRDTDRERKLGFRGYQVKSFSTFDLYRIYSHTLLFEEETGERKRKMLCL